MADRDKIEKRGFAYRCAKCKNYEGERRYVEAHYYKYHTTLDSVPYYCSLCHFMGKTERELLKHLKGYRPHKQAIEELERRNATISPQESYIHKNANPVKVDDSCLLKLSLEESRRVWLGRQKNPGEPEQTEDQADPLKEVPAALAQPEPTVPSPVLPPIELPLEAEEYDVLQDILDSDEGSKINRFKEESRKEEKLEVQKKLLDTMEALLQATQQNGQLLTTLNMGVRKNTMVVEEMVETMKESMVEERRWRGEERRWRAETRRWWAEERRRCSEDQRRLTDRRTSVLGRAAQGSSAASGRRAPRVKSVVHRIDE